MKVSESNQGVGESLLFPPQYENEEEAQLAILVVVRRSPRLFGHEQSRWTLASIIETCSWLELVSLPGLWQLLKRLNIRYKRARSYIHSPDLYYDEKLAYLQQCLHLARENPERIVFLYLDEVTYYRQPTLASAYEVTGSQQPLARRSHAANTWFRVLASLDALTGKTLYVQRSRISRKYLSEFYESIYEAYPWAEVIYVAQDNWPVHYHPDVLARLQPQNFPWQPTLPDHWPTEPGPQAVHDDLPIQLLFLPSYASWLNPIEKLWRWLKQRVIHLHEFSDDWQTLKQRVADFLDQFSADSTELLRYTGLLYG